MDHYSRSGQPITTEEWAARFEDSDYRRIALDTIGKANVSTVWLGTDHNWSGAGDPLIFETMIFGGEHSDLQWRYTTEVEAKEGHARIVQALKEGQAP